MKTINTENTFLSETKGFRVLLQYDTIYVKTCLGNNAIDF